MKNCLPTSFEKEDIEKWQQSIIPKIDILLAGNSYEHEITEKVLTNLIQNCTASGQFSFEVSCLLQKVRKEVKTVHFMEKAKGACCEFKVISHVVGICSNQTYCRLQGVIFGSGTVN